eukprot:215373-Chlamydomonas_euryale.AAC.1
MADPSTSNVGTNMPSAKRPCTTPAWKELCKEKKQGNGLEEERSDGEKRTPCCNLNTRLGRAAAWSIGAS